MDDIEITFPGGERVEARVGELVIHADQPFDLFLASIGACAGVYILAFCRARGLPAEGIQLHQHVVVDEVSKLPNHVRLEIVLPRTFPEKYRAAVVRAADGCKVKKTIAAAPVIDVVLADTETIARAS